jgi:hypothetical protein
LQKSAQYGYLEIVEFLLEHGASITYNAICDAALNGHLEIVKILYKKSTTIDICVIKRIISQCRNTDCYQPKVVKYLSDICDSCN